MRSKSTIKLILLIAIVFIAGIYIGCKAKRFMDIDHCLDHGGSWNYETKDCEYAPIADASDTDIYIQAIGDFIKAANKRNSTPFDTLFIANRKKGQPDDFPEITLPAKIDNTVILLIDPQQVEKSQQARKSRIYINLVGWVDNESAEFIFVIFSNGMEHQYDYHIHYAYDAKRGGYQLEKVESKGH